MSNDYSQEDLKALQLAQMKRHALSLLSQAASAMHSYAAECDVGQERNKAFDAYECIINAIRGR